MGSMGTKAFRKHAVGKAMTPVPVTESKRDRKHKSKGSRKRSQTPVGTPIMGDDGFPAIRPELAKSRSAEKKKDKKKRRKDSKKIGKSSDKVCFFVELDWSVI